MNFKMEDYTLHDVLNKIKLVQEMKLLFLQGVNLSGRDIRIHHVIDEKALINILTKYQDHYDDVMGGNNTITIFNLSKSSFLRKGLEKQVLPFMKPYMTDNNQRRRCRVKNGVKWVWMEYLPSTAFINQVTTSTNKA